jgi:hypothetical protein
MRQLLPIFVAIICLWAAGCGSGLLKPQGRLVKKGAPLVPGDGEAIHVAFYPDGEQTDQGAYPAKFNNQDGTFRVLGVDGRGLPPGTYRATVQIMKKRKDVLEGAFGKNRSPFSIDITPASGEITLDLDTPPLAPAQTQRRENRRRG